jgi:hypothetical protein
MKSQIKDIVIGIFAVIGFTAIVMGFNNPAEPQEVINGTPESHVWEIMTAFETTGQERVYSLNKATGEVRKYSKASMSNGKLKDQYYQVLKENKEGEK